jgi:hypothetical protein
MPYFLSIASKYPNQDPQIEMDIYDSEEELREKIKDMGFVQTSEIIEMNKHVWIKDPIDKQEVFIGANYIDSEIRLWNFALGCSKENISTIRSRVRGGMGGTFAQMIEFVTQYVPKNNLIAGGKTEDKNNMVEWRIYVKNDDDEWTLMPAINM